MRVMIDKPTSLGNPRIGSYFADRSAEVVIIDNCRDIMSQSMEPTDILIVQSASVNPARWAADVRRSAPEAVLVLATPGLPDDVRLASLEAGFDDILDEGRLDEVLLKAGRLANNRRALRASTMPSEPVAGIMLHPSGRCVTIQGNGIFLSSREFRVFQLLVESAGSVVRRDLIMDDIYRGISLPDERVVNVFVSMIRSKISNIPHAPTIKSVRGRGYRLVLDDKNRSHHKEGREVEERQPRPGEVTDRASLGH